MKEVIIIDDEPLAIALVTEYLTRYPGVQTVATCSNGFEGLKAIQEFKPDLVFLDIQMPKLSGLEMLELIEDPLHVIFTTAFDEYAVKAFDAHAVDYLLKPFSEERFMQAMSRWQQRMTSGPPEDLTAKLVETMRQDESRKIERVVVRSGNNIRILSPGEITFVEAYDDYVKINIPGDCFLKKQTLQQMEKLLAPFSFIRVHRSFLVRADTIVTIEPYMRDHYQAILTDKSIIPLSKTGYARLKEFMGS